MKALVTGGGGYIGHVLVDALLEQGHEVTVFDRFYFGDEALVAKSQGRSLRLVRGDLRAIDASVLRGHDTLFAELCEGVPYALEMSERLGKSFRRDEEPANGFRMPR